MMPANPVGQLHLKQKSRELILGMWASELGMDMLELLAPNKGVWISPSREFDEIVVVRIGQDVRISASPFRIGELTKRLRGTAATSFCSPDFWQKNFPDWSESITGPSTHYYLDSLEGMEAGLPTTQADVQVRGLAASDFKVCAALASELTRDEREAGGLDVLSRHAWGVFCEETLASVASYESWPGRIAHIGVVTRPGFRGRKFAQLAVRAALQGILRRRRIAQFHCSSDDASGNGVALALGFHPIVETLSLRPPSHR